MTYPNGKVINYAYSSGLNANISRLSSLAVGATTVEGYMTVSWANFASTFFIYSYA